MSHEAFIIKKIYGNGPHRRRLMELGFTPGVSIKIKRNIFGNIIYIRNTRIAINNLGLRMLSIDKTMGD
jgi:Fe2+ transport system protein FeoA